MKEELSGGMSSLAHWTTMFSFFRRNSLFTVKKAKKMERFVTAKDGDVQHFTDAASAKNTKASKVPLDFPVLYSFVCLYVGLGGRSINP